MNEFRILIEQKQKKITVDKIHELAVSYYLLSNADNIDPNNYIESFKEEILSLNNLYVDYFKVRMNKSIVDKYFDKHIFPNENSFIDVLNDAKKLARNIEQRIGKPIKISWEGTKNRTVSSTDYFEIGAADIVVITSKYPNGISISLKFIKGQLKNLSIKSINSIMSNVYKNNLQMSDTVDFNLNKSIKYDKDNVNKLFNEFFNFIAQVIDKYLGKVFPEDSKKILEILYKCKSQGDYSKMKVLGLSPEFLVIVENKETLEDIIRKLLQKDKNSIPEIKSIQSEYYENFKTKVLTKYVLDKVVDVLNKFDDNFIDLFIELTSSQLSLINNRYLYVEGNKIIEFPTRQEWIKVVKNFVKTNDKIIPSLIKVLDEYADIKIRLSLNEIIIIDIIIRFKNGQMKWSGLQTSSNSEFDNNIEHFYIDWLEKGDSVKSALYKNLKKD